MRGLFSDSDDRGYRQYGFRLEENPGRPPASKTVGYNVLNKTFDSLLQRQLLQGYLKSTGLQHKKC